MMCGTPKDGSMELELLSNEDNDICQVTPKYNESVFPNYDELILKYMPFVKRSYEGLNWYYVTITPFNKNYERDKEWYNSGKAYNAIRRKLTQEGLCETDYVITREKDNCAKTHFNVLCVTANNWPAVPNVFKMFKFSCHTQHLNDLGDRIRVLQYIFKDAKHRHFYEFKDYDDEIDWYVKPIDDDYYSDSSSCLDAQKYACPYYEANAKLNEEVPIYDNVQPTILEIPFGIFNDFNFKKDFCQ